MASHTHTHTRFLTGPSFLAALRSDRFDARCVIDGPINGQSFLAYVEQILVLTLKPDDIVDIVLSSSTIATREKPCAL